jgi:hypothetical protein
MIDIKGLDKAEVLACLYNHSKPLGRGLLQYDPTPMTKEQAHEIIYGRGDDCHAMFGGDIRQGYGPGTFNFDYLKGRVMKVDLSGDEFDEGLYDRDVGDGAAARAIQSLRP